MPIYKALMNIVETTAKLHWHLYSPPLPRQSRHQQFGHSSRRDPRQFDEDKRFRAAVASNLARASQHLASLLATRL